jgi:hypothetical protein
MINMKRVSEKGFNKKKKIQKIGNKYENRVKTKKTEKKNAEKKVKKVENRNECLISLVMC